MHGTPNYSLAMRELLLAGWLLTVPLYAAETGYRIVHPDGTVEYSDQPAQKAEEIPLQEISTYPGGGTPSSVISQSAGKKNNATRDSEDYTLFTIASPQNNQTLWFDEQGMTVAIHIGPKLVEGDMLAVYIDGKLVATGVATTYQIKDIFRGTHALTASILDSQGVVLRQAGPVVFHMRQHSRLYPQDQQN